MASEALRRFMSGSIDVSAQAADFNLRHIFNKTSASSNYGFYYYPFGYLYRHLRWGAVNSLGFRAPEFSDLTTDSRFKIGVFGGSTVFDVLVPPEQSFCCQLNLILNDWRTADGRELLVVNMGQPGATLSTQIVLLSLYFDIVKFDYIISHGPFNDLAYGQMNDPYFVGELKLSYPDICEGWSAVVHDGEESADVFHSNPSSNDFQPAIVRNTPEAVLAMVLQRVETMQRITFGLGGGFMYAVQPWLGCKHNLSFDEALAAKGYNRYHENVYRSMPLLYPRIEEILQSRGDPSIVSFSRIFNEGYDDETCFGDVIHLTARGNAVIAKSYAEEVVRRLQLIHV